jgi:hypothetical protein
MDRKQLADVLERVDQEVHFVVGIVQVKARPGGGFGEEALMEGLGAVVPGADGDALLVQDLGDIVRMHARECERYGRASLLWILRAVQFDPFD